jgi:hypothetical protein
MTSLQEELETRSWASLTGPERTAWLHLFVLGRTVKEQDGQLIDSKGKLISAKPNSLLVYRCEQVIKNTAIETFYVDACIIEISNITYKGLTTQEAASPLVSKKYYRNTIFLSTDLQAKALFWAVKKSKLNANP